MKTVCIVSQNSEARAVLAECLSAEYRTEFFSTARDCLARLPGTTAEFLLVDLHELYALNNTEVPSVARALTRFWDLCPSLEIILLCAPDEIRLAVDAVRAGASNYLTYPPDKKEVRFIIDTTLEAARVQGELDFLRDRFWDADSLKIISTQSPLMREVFHKVRSVAPGDSSVLISGETGTGKGVVAKLIHSHSSRKDKPFISLHCGAIPENLIESELFGHEKGAFTGAVRRKIGKFEIAREGTLFLDEIGTMPLVAQIKLLQVLQERAFTRVGGEDAIESQVRIIAATNGDLQAMADQGQFRLDLFYRLNVFPLRLPPLRERPEDIEMLAREFLNRLNKKYGRTIARIYPETLCALQRYSWPGNIRELENLIERAYILETSQILTPESFPSELFSLSETHTGVFLNTSLTLAQVRDQSLMEIERNYLKEKLSECQGRIDATAGKAGISTRQLHKLLTRHGIRKEDYKPPRENRN